MELKHFEWAKVSNLLAFHILVLKILQDRILMGAERRSQYIPEKEKRDTAYHEVHYHIPAFR